MRKFDPENLDALRIPFSACNGASKRSTANPDFWAEQKKAAEAANKAAAASNPSFSVSSGNSR